jgi:hypothetical protein
MLLLGNGYTKKSQTRREAGTESHGSLPKTAGLPKRNKFNTNKGGSFYADFNA